jgi:hypothetical protein
MNGDVSQKKKKKKIEKRDRQRLSVKVCITCATAARERI